MDETQTDIEVVFSGPDKVLFCACSTVRYKAEELYCNKTDEKRKLRLKVQFYSMGPLCSAKQFDMHIGDGSIFNNVTVLDLTQ